MNSKRRSRSKNVPVDKHTSVIQALPSLYNLRGDSNVTWNLLVHSSVYLLCLIEILRDSNFARIPYFGSQVCHFKVRVQTWAYFRSSHTYPVKTIFSTIRAHIAWKDFPMFVTLLLKGFLKKELP
ncbi:hypothetical protein AVEN_230467-1 [Araneus ventricosus]|uniref:Uncharacterized protein n=1 Tax=Araneus ventricosus TaxID=182803 RepID=A0A4Y2RIC7_ARAVE|nr:hypothetical protein AVEN_230467-1 [Araneus ventricosus]